MTKLARFRVPLTWAVLGPALLFAHVTFMFMDLTNTIENSNFLIDAIREGRFLDFYEISAERAHTNWAANYNLLIYVIFGIWQLPLYVLAHVCERTYLEWLPSMLWSKTLVLLFSLGVAWMIARITRLCVDDGDEADGAVLPRLAAFLYLSSMATLFSVGLCGQLDAISSFFSLWGVYAYIKHDIKRFWLFFAIAAPLKMFALLLALPLVLAREKRLPRALLFWASMAVLIVIERFVFAGSPSYRVALASQSRDAISYVLSVNIGLDLSFAPFVAGYLVLVLWAYIKCGFTRHEAVWCGLAIWGGFVALSPLTKHWVYLFAPWFALCVATNARQRKAAALLETLGSAAYFLAACANNWVPFFDRAFVSHLVVPRLVHMPDSSIVRYANMGDFFSRLSLTQYSALFTNVFVTATLALIVLTFPHKRSAAGDEVAFEFDVDKPGTGALGVGESGAGESERGMAHLSGEDVQSRTDASAACQAMPTPALLLVRPVVILAACCLSLVPYLATTNPVAYDTLGREAVEVDANLTAEEHAAVVEQPLRFEDDRALEKVVLRLSNGGWAVLSRQDMALLYVELCDATTGECVFNTAEGCSFIPDGEDYTIDLKGAPVQAGREYTLRLSGRPSIEVRRERDRLVPCFVQAEGSGLAPARVDGREAKGCLCVLVR